jgi:hypothetical protein
MPVAQMRWCGILLAFFKSALISTTDKERGTHEPMMSLLNGTAFRTTACGQVMKE